MDSNQFTERDISTLADEVRNKILSLKDLIKVSKGEVTVRIFRRREGITDINVEVTL